MAQSLSAAGLKSRRKEHIEMRFRQQPGRFSASALRPVVLSAIFLAGMRAAEPGNAGLERGFTRTVRPFLSAYCVGCHGGSSPAAHFDLSAYSTVAAVIRD